MSLFPYVFIVICFDNYNSPLPNLFTGECPDYYKDNVKFDSVFF